MNLKLTIRRPGSLLSVLMKADITEAQYHDIVNYLRHPEQYRVTRQKVMGFRDPQGGANARS